MTLVRPDRDQRVFIQTVDAFGNNLTSGRDLLSAVATLEQASFNASYGEYGQRLLDGVAVTRTTAPPPTAL